MAANDNPIEADLRRQLHRIAELAETERKTAGYIARALSATAPDQLLEGLGSMQTGVCAVYDSGRPGPVILLRAELDALPIVEANDFAHRSVHEGVSHKCGHDGHMAILCRVAEGLTARPIERGAVYLLFQPAEETGKGAAAVLADERFRALPPPDAVYALHNVPKFPLGHVLVRRGLFAQASTGFLVRFRGTTSHLSYPEHGINPSAAVTGLVDTVNAFGDYLGDRVSEPVLGTISYAELGSRGRGLNFGTAPGDATVTGVIRACSTHDLDAMQSALAELVDTLATRHGLQYALEWHETFAATRSADACVDVVEHAAREQGLTVDRLDEAFRWSEDFGYFTDAFPGAFFGLGAGSDHPQLHDEHYDFPDALTDTGASLFRAIIDRHIALAGGSA